MKFPLKFNVNNIFQQCDFQKYRNIIIPPACVQLERGVVSNIKHPGDSDWEPFIIVGRCLLEESLFF